MVSPYLTCPLCGFEFEKVDTLCAHGCPLGASCDLIRCPSCEYEFPARPRSIPRLRRLFQLRVAKHPERPAGIRTVRELKGGERAKVVSLGGPSRSRHNTLVVFGLAPGAEITLMQQRPSCVVRVGQTELALDPDIASEILVQQVDEDEARSRQAGGAF